MSCILFHFQVFCLLMMCLWCWVELGTMGRGALGGRKATPNTVFWWRWLGVFFILFFYLQLQDPECLTSRRTPIEQAACFMAHSLGYVVLSLAHTASSVRLSGQLSSHREQRPRLMRESHRHFFPPLHWMSSHDLALMHLPSYATPMERPSRHVALLRWHALAYTIPSFPHRYCSDDVTSGQIRLHVTQYALLDWSTTHVELPGQRTSRHVFLHLPWYCTSKSGWPLHFVFSSAHSSL